MNRRDVIKRTAVLMGGIVSAPTIMAIMKGCKAKPTVDWKPAFFTEDQAITITEIAEIIIPATDTPGAKDVGVPAFIEEMIQKVYGQEDRDRFMTGLQSFMQDAEAKYDDAFIDLEAAEQLEFVKQVHDAAIQENTQKRPFILIVKELTLTGFFTSQPGATEVLQYEAIPGRYFGCKPLSEVGGKTWAT